MAFLDKRDAFRWFVVCLALALGPVGVHPAWANVASVTCDGTTTMNCALKVKKILADPATSAEQAIAAWGAWADVYERAYRNMSNAPVPASDLQKIEDAVADKVDSYTNPVSIALDQAIKRFFPRLAGLIAFTEGPAVVAVYTFFSPSPTVTPIQELKLTNDELSQGLLVKLAPVLRFGWRDEFSKSVVDSLNTGTIGPTP